MKKNTNSISSNFLTKADLDFLEMRKTDSSNDFAGNGTNMYKLANEESFPLSNYISAKAGKLPNRSFDINNHKSDIELDNIIRYVTEVGWKLVYEKETYTKSDNHSNVKYIYEMETDSGITILHMGGYRDCKNLGKDKWIVLSTYVSILSVDNTDVHMSMQKLIIDSVVVRPAVSNNVQLVVATNGGYSTNSFELPKTELDISLNYGSEFLPIHEKIITRLNEENGKGLVLLHGMPGTGKTHYLKYLASKIENKQVLFIPPFLADFITSPEMTPFLIENANSILFIEDAERVITDRSVNGSNGVSNILNLTDGILSDILNIQIVATFNMDKHKIDSALLRKGRLIAEHRFDALSKEDSQKLLNHLNIDYTATTAMPLTDIYNVMESEYKSEAENKIGFGYQRRG